MALELEERREKKAGYHLTREKMEFQFPFPDDII